MDGHPDEPPRRNERIDGPEAAFLDPGMNVAAQEFMQAFDPGFEEDVGQLVSFERAEQEQTHEAWVFFGLFHHL